MHNLISFWLGVLHKCAGEPIQGFSLEILVVHQRLHWLWGFQYFLERFLGGLEFHFELAILELELGVVFLGELLVDFELLGVGF